MALRGIIFFLLGAGFWFLAKWATAKLHRFTVFSPYFSPLFNFCSLFFFIGFGSIAPLCWLPFLVAASDLSAPKKCRARFGLDQQNNWCGPCRCVWCVLALARARWRLGHSTLGLPPLFYAAAFPFSSLPSPVCPARLLWPLSFLQPHPAGLSLGSPYLIFYLLFGEKGFAYECLYEWCLCVCVQVAKLQDAQLQWALLRLIRSPKLAGRGLEVLEPDGLVNMEDIPVLPA